MLPICRVHPTLIMIVPNPLTRFTRLSEIYDAGMGMLPSSIALQSFEAYWDDISFRRLSAAKSTPLMRRFAPV